MAASRRPRLDLWLVEAGLVATREKAHALVLAGRVTIDGRRADKPGTPVHPEAKVALQEPEHPFVGRGGIKLAGALDALAVDARAAICLDLGASTGGFTDCLLQRGAARVYAVDVGHRLLDSRLAVDPRVIVLDRTNARHLGAAEVPEPIDLAVADLAFISLRLVLPALVARLGPRGRALLMVKPQFELGRGEVGRGVVRDPELQARAVRSIARTALDLGLQIRGVAPSAIRGQKGNREFFLLAARETREQAAGLDAAEIEAAIGAAVGTS